MNENPETFEIDGARARVWRDAPAWQTLKTAAIGALEIGSVEAGERLFKHIATTLYGEDFQALIGPMDGDTWHSYRVVTASDDEPPFLMEPVSGPHDLAALANSGFQPVSNYVSAIAGIDDTIDGAAVDVPGVTVSAWDGQGAEMLIGQLFDMSAQAFSGNSFFKPITKEAFLALYAPVMPMIDPEHVLFARTDDGQLAGFLFGMPNLLAPQSKTAILKTYASGVRGVGHLLADTYHRKIRTLGFERVIHALMHEDNISKTRSNQHNARVFRRYALMGRTM